MGLEALGLVIQVPDVKLSHIVQCNVDVKKLLFLFTRGKSVMTTNPSIRIYASKASRPLLATTTPSSKVLHL